MDRYWAIWQDCYDYDKVLPYLITNVIFPQTWTAGLFITKSYTIDGDMPYNYPGLPDLSTRLSVGGSPPSSPTPRNMHFIGNSFQEGYNGMYYCYGPDLLVTTMTSTPSFAGVCNFDNTIVNVPVPGKKRQSDDINLPKNVFNNSAAQQQLNQINYQYGYHTSHQKVHYLALWECSRQNSVPNRNYTIPEGWLVMNGQDPSQWMTTCQREGWLEGWATLAWLDDQQYANQQVVAKVEWIVPVVVVVVVIVVLGAIGLSSLFFYKKKQIEHVGGDDREELREELQEPLVEL